MASVAKSELKIVFPKKGTKVTKVVFVRVTLKKVDPETLKATAFQKDERDIDGVLRVFAKKKIVYLFVLKGIKPEKDCTVKVEALDSEDKPVSVTVDLKGLRGYRSKNQRGYHSGPPIFIHPPSCPYDLEPEEKDSFITLGHVDDNRDIDRVTTIDADGFHDEDDDIWWAVFDPLTAGQKTLIVLDSANGLASCVINVPNGH